MMVRHGGKNAPWRSLLQTSASSAHNNQTIRRTMAFKPRRTPPPSIAGVNLAPRPDPHASLAPDPAYDRSKRGSTRLGGEGLSDDWVSPHHKDYYDRVDSSTMDHGELLHGDPHMPIQRLSRGDGKVVLDPFGRKAKELNHYSKLGQKDMLMADLDGYADVDDYVASDGKDDTLIEKEPENDKGKRLLPRPKSLTMDKDDIMHRLTLDEDDEDELDAEFGSDAADAIRQHLNKFHKRLNSSKLKESKTYSPLEEVEEGFRTIDRVTAAQGSTQDLALKRRARTESREFLRLGRIPKLVDGDAGDEFDGDWSEEQGGDDESEKEFGHGRGYDAQSVFGKGAKVHFPDSKEWPSPTYHKDFPKGSFVGNNPNDPDEEKWMHELNKLIYEEQGKEMELGEIDETYTPVNIQKEDMDAYLAEKKRTKKFNMNEREEHEKDREEKPDEILEMVKSGLDPNQEAFGPWGECTIKVDRVQKVERGGTTVRYRALVIGGNGNGAGGFGIGKALTPNEAIEKACKHCKRNVFYIDRYLNTGLSYDLAGKHNSCKVRLRATSPDYGLHGHPLICEILKYAGISDATGKSHGNRNPYNVVYATFKALMTHESLEEIAMKRGKKLLNLQRARRLGV